MEISWNTAYYWRQWILLTCSVVYSIENKIKSNLGIAFASACLLVLLDILIEPVAIYNFWSWNETIVPIKNYIAWFIISFIFLLCNCLL
jgi:putative membrane protein